jgi:hypothetical protein
LSKSFISSAVNPQRRRRVVCARKLKLLVKELDDVAFSNHGTLLNIKVMVHNGLEEGKFLLSEAARKAPLRWNRHMNTIKRPRQSIIVAAKAQ